MNDYQGKIFVIKWGGAALNNTTSIYPLIESIANLCKEGILPVIVHGGGPEISSFCEQLNLSVNFVHGQRYTDAATLEIAQMILFGKINRSLVTAFNQQHIKAVGLTGQDSAFMQAKQWQNADGSDLGFVGEITSVQVDLIELLLSKQYLPVISPIATDHCGQAYNINADLAAAAIASALHADKLFIFSDVNGLYANAQDPSTRIPALKSSQLESWLKAGKISGGMAPKALACIQAVNKGVSSAHILEAKNDSFSFNHFLANENKGTRIYHE